MASDDLPLEPASELGASSNPVGETPPDPGVRTRVLVVEDSPINQLVARRQLERLGYDAVVVSTGHEALESFERMWSGLEPRVGAVLMDWQLPGIDGLETTRRLRAAESERGCERTPVIAMTASAMVGDRDRCIAAGMDDFVTKPVQLDVIGDVLARWTHR